MFNVRWNVPLNCDSKKKTAVTSANGESKGE